MNSKIKKQHLLKTEIFCYIINVFTVTFDQNASLMNTIIKLFIYIYIYIYIYMFIIYVYIRVVKR